MKNILLITFVLSSFVAFAQDEKEQEQEDTQYSSPHFDYMEIGGGYGTHGLASIAMDFVRPNAMFTTGVYFCSRRDPNMPPDYSPGLLEGYPQQKLIMLGFMYGKAYSIPNSHIRYTLKGGLAIGITQSPTDYTPSGGLFSATYSYNTTQEFAAGILVNPSIDFLIRPHAGLSLGLFGSLNTVSPVLGIEGTMLLGKLRNSTNKEIGRSNRRRRHKI